MVAAGSDGLRQNPRTSPAIAWGRLQYGNVHKLRPNCSSPNNTFSKRSACSLQEIPCCRRSAAHAGVAIGCPRSGSDTAALGKVLGLGAVKAGYAVNDTPGNTAIGAITGRHQARQVRDRRLRICVPDRAWLANFASHRFSVLACWRTDARGRNAGLRSGMPGGSTPPSHDINTGSAGLQRIDAIHVEDRFRHARQDRLRPDFDQAPQVALRI